VLQEDAAVNHVAAKIIDGISARPGPHASVRLVQFMMIYVFIYYMVYTHVKSFTIVKNN